MAAVDDQQIRDIVASYPATPGQAMEQLKPMARDGDLRAIVLLAYGYLQQDAMDEGILYAKQAVEREVGAVAQTYAVDLVNRGRDDLRAKAPEFVIAAIESGWTIDLRSLFAQALGEANGNRALEALSLALGPPPPIPARMQWEELVTKAHSDGEQIATAAAAVGGQREVALQQIGEEIEKARAKGADIERLAEGLGVLANVAGSVSLARSYAQRASREERMAERYTFAWLFLAGMAVVLAAVIALLTLNEAASISTAAQRAAFAIPLAVFAAVISRLAHSYRVEAWKLRHIELQIETSNPFLAGLDEADRKKILAELALRFFPGQVNPGETSSDTEVQPSTVQVDPVQLFGALTRAAQGGSVPVTGEPPTPASE